MATDHMAQTRVIAHLTLRIGWQVQRQKMIDIASLAEQLEASERRNQALSDDLASANTQLSHRDESMRDMSTEMSLLRNKLAATEAVAGKVAAAELRGGSTLIC